MYAYIYRRVGDAAQAEDLTSELFLRVLRAIQNEQAWHKSFSAWLYRAAHNLVVDHYRQRPAFPPVPLDEGLVASEDSPAAAFEEVLSAERLRDAIERLTPEQQEVLALRYGEGLKAREVGEIMGKTTGSVEALQRRGLAALRRQLLGES
jgi:RNA polymerase sigma-70 factor (ECF subfamily)